jgi:hypothetical protein
VTNPETTITGAVPYIADHLPPYLIAAKAPREATKMDSPKTVFDASINFLISGSRTRKDEYPKELITNQTTVASQARFSSFVITSVL